MNMVIMIPKKELGPRVNMFQLVRKTLNVSSKFV